MEEVVNVVIEIDDEKKEMKWVTEVKDNLKSMEDKDMEKKRWEKRSIYKVAASVTDRKKVNAYKPQAVSFGPYHHGEDHLKLMEDDKHRALLHFLKRSGKPLELFVESLNAVARDLKDAYDFLDSKWENDTSKFLKLMIVDGCFMLEILRMEETQTPPKDYADNDPIFSKHGMLYILPYIRRDMLMLENQLPMLLLDKLVEVEGGNHDKDEEYVNNLILKFWYSPPKRKWKIGKCFHVLDVYRKSLLLHDPSPSTKGVSFSNCVSRIWQRMHHHGEDVDPTIRSATELDEAGIKFKKSKTDSLKDISFHGGTLSLPLLLVDDATESRFLNLIAFERFHVGAGNEVTSYIYFMDNIIDSARDVALLHNKGIIQNAVGSDKALATLFNTISKDITLDPASKLWEVHRNVSRYCKKPWNAWRANLSHTYLRSPWAIISVIAAVFLFALTILQTIYTIYPFYHPTS